MQELSEELTDLKDQKLYLMRQAYCDTDAEMASAEKRIKLSEEFGERFAGKKFKELSRENDTELGENGAEMERRQWKMKLERNKAKADARKQTVQEMKHKRQEQEIS